jgi:hypothetical protein
LLAPLAAIFAGLPPSSSELAERKSVFHHLLLQNGGANIAESVYLVVARCERQREKSTKETTPRAVFDCSLRSLRLALAAPAWLSAAARFPSAVFLLAAT